MEKDQEIRLIELCKQGNINAFEELIGRYQKSAYNIALRTIGNQEDAYDITQDALIKVFKNIKSFKGDSAFSSWLFRIVTNTALDEVKRRNRHNSTSLDQAMEQAPNISMADTSMGPQDVLEFKEDLELVKRALMLLSIEHRTIITLRDINGFSYDDISSILDITTGTVKSRINRARSSLKDVINKLMEQRGSYLV